MKKTLSTILAILFSLVFILPGFAETGLGGSVPKEKSPEGAKCPVTTLTDQGTCYDCHEIRQVDDKWKWVIKLRKFHELTDAYYHEDFVRIINGEVEGYYNMDGSVSVMAFKVFSNYMYQIGVKRVTIDISSGGGSLIDGWEICSLIQQMSNQGIKVTTQVRAYCASAAFLILVSGDIRLVEPTAYLMTHELWTLAWLKLDTPSSKEDEAITMRMFQDVIHEWLAERSGITKEELDKRVRHKDWWMSGKAAVEEWKFATGYIK